MKILVCIKRVIDYAVSIRIKSDGSGVETENVKMGMNPFDAIALEEALRLKEKHPGMDITALSIGPLSHQETLRLALAMGADRAILVNANGYLEALNIAKIIKYITEKEKPDLVFLGKQAIDDDCNQTGQMLAGLLQWPQACFISRFSFNDNQTSATITREIDSGLEILEIMLPAVITTDLRLNAPRFASLPNIMRARQKPIEIMSLDDPAFQTLNLMPHTEILKTEAPPSRTAGVMLDNWEALIPYLQPYLPHSSKRENPK
jgi:electron transfer flavoprotein beta subunit